jgi:DNA-binding transcriptional ArsR family regulator
MVNEAVVFNALGDSTRLTIVKRLSAGKYLTITEVSSGLPLTRQGVRRHLQVLADAELVRLQPEGRDVLVHLNPSTLEKAKQWIAKLEQQWDKRLTALKGFVEGDN